MAKIYVSSTFLDLQNHREQVEKVIRRMGHTDVAMEYYVAEDQRPVDRCLSDVEACDLYIGIFAWRYGWIPTKKNRKKISITEMEYRQAQKSNKPCLIFLLDGKAAWPPDFIDDDKTQVKKLRNELSEAHGTGPGFKSSDELGRLVAEAIHNWEKEQGLIHATASIPEYDLNTYYEALRKRYNVLALEGLTPPQKEEYLQIQLRSVFVEQSVREDTPPVELPKGILEKLIREQEINEEDLPSGITLDDLHEVRESYYQKPSRLVLDALTDKNNKYTIILGDPGSGKSTLARYLMLSLIDPLLEDEKIQNAFDGYLPLLIELRAFVGAYDDGKCETPLEYLEYLGKTEGWGLTQAALRNHLKNDGRAVVIFDGLDEIFESQMRETVTKQIVGFTNDYPKARVIVTSRILGYRRSILSAAEFKHFTLQDLNEKQVEAFITKWYELAMSDRLDEARERGERILKSFANSPSIRQLAGNPMLLTIMAIIGKHQELPRERWKLYDHAASVLIQHWDVNKHLKDEHIEADFIGEDDKKELLRRLAYRMQSGDGGLAGNYIHRESLQDEFESYLKDRYSQKPDRAKIIAEAMIQQFRERNFILSLYGANLYGFVHRAFLEYFCASAFIWKFEKTKELTIEDFKTEVYGQHWDDQNWHEVLRLICGMINEKWAGELIGFLSEKVYCVWPSGFRNSPPWNIALAVQCLGEIRNIGLLSNLIGHLIQTICQLFDHLLKNDDNSINSFLLDQVLRHMQLIILEQPHYTLVIEWLSGMESYSSALKFIEPFGTFVGLVGKNNKEIHRVILRFVSSADKNYRVLAPFALAKGWQNDLQTKTILHNLIVEDNNRNVRATSVYALARSYWDVAEIRSLLRERVVEDPYPDVRSAAIYALAEHCFNDPETFPLLRERAMEDIHQLVRSTSIRAMAKFYNNDSKVLILIKDRAINDSHQYVRTAAVYALERYLPYDPQILEFIRDRVLRDPHKHTRSSIILLLAKKFQKHPETIRLLYDRAVNDETPQPNDESVEHLHYVRETAINTIAEYWPNHPDTLPLLRDRAENDPTPWLRKRCRELIEEIEGKKE